MVLPLLLPWFPIILAVGVGARLLGRSRGLGLGVMCALFWVALVQATSGLLIWRDPWIVAAMVAGAIAITGMGSWAGGGSIATLSRGPSTAISVGEEYRPGDELMIPMARLSAAMEQFEDWQNQNRLRNDPWVAFDEFLRSMLYQCCRATRVRTYRLSGDGHELVPLHEANLMNGEERPSACRGIVGHVITSGRSYAEGDESQSELLGKLACESDGRQAWCFSIHKAGKPIGAVTAGRLGIEPTRHRAWLRTVEQLTNQFWNSVSEMARGLSASRFDPVSGLLTRPALLEAAEEALRESYAQNEPMAVAVIALEAVREINDSGRWETADELIAEVSKVLRAKLRSDDRLGRFDDSRFVLLLRRVDSELASLIVTQIVARLQAVCQEAERWRAAVQIRCGLSGSGLQQPDLRTLLSRALRQWRRAMEEDLPIASDVSRELEPSGATT